MRDDSYSVVTADAETTNQNKPTSTYKPNTINSSVFKTNTTMVNSKIPKPDDNNNIKEVRYNL